MKVSEYSTIYFNVGHPERVKILLYLRRYPVTSPTIYFRAKEVDPPHPSKNVVAHYFRELARYGHIKEVHTAARRGAVEHFYSLTDSGKLLLSVFDFDQPI
jgi:hypothetical protein